MKLVKPKKFLGQHFLKDLKVAQDIAMGLLRGDHRGVKPPKREFVPSY